MYQVRRRYTVCTPVGDMFGSSLYKTQDKISWGFIWFLSCADMLKQYWLKQQGLDKPKC